MKRMLSISSELNIEVDKYLDGRNFSQWICSLIKDNLGVTLKGPVVVDTKFTVGEVFNGTGKEFEEKVFHALPERDDFGQPVKTMSEALQNTKKTLAMPKSKRVFCQHGITVNGFCKKCEEDK